MFMDIADTGERLVAVGERGHIVYTDNKTTRRWTQARVPVSVTLTATVHGKSNLTAQQSTH